MRARLVILVLAAAAAAGVMGAAGGGLAEPAFRVPMKVVINDATAMECEPLVARAAPPLGPCNGLVAIDAVNPNDPQKRVAVRLPAARRGKDPTHAAR